MNSTHSRICRKDRFWLDFLGKIWYIEDMENTVRKMAAKNLIELRKRKNFTQGELAEMLNYSDKTISKWENGDSLPDISVLASLAEIYGITLDDLIHENAAEKVADKAEEKKALERYNQWIILSLSVVVVFLIATLIFVYLKLKANIDYWQAFVWAVPVSCLALLWKNRKSEKGIKMSKVYRAVVLSVLCWSLLAAVYLQLLEYRVWLIFILGIPVELIIWLSSKLNK